MLAAFELRCGVCGTVTVLNHPEFAVAIIRCPCCANTLYIASAHSDLADTLEEEREKDGYGHHMFLDLATALAVQMATYHKNCGAFGALSPRRVVLCKDGVDLLPALKCDVAFGKADWASERSKYVEHSVDYIAPELFRGDRSSSMAADIYSLGSVFAFLQLGRNPFDGLNLTECLAAKQNGPIRLEESIESHRDVSGLVARMTAVSPSERLQSVEAIFAALTKMHD